MSKSLNDYKVALSNLPKVKPSLKFGLKGGQGVMPTGGKQRWRKKQFSKVEAPKFSLPAQKDRTKTKVNTAKNGWTVITGSAFLTPTAFTNDADNQPGFRLMVIRLNPYLFGINRLQNFARMFEFWKINSIKLVYDPNIPSTFTGTLDVAADFDSLELWPTVGGKQNVDRAGQAADKGKWRPCDSMTFKLDRTSKHPSTTKWYYCDTNDLEKRMWSPGEIYVIVDSQLLDATSTAVKAGVQIGKFTIEYTICFSTPQYEDYNIGVGIRWDGYDTITAAAPWGIAPATKTWSNLALNSSLTDHTGYFDLPMGSYRISYNITGTGISVYGLTFAGVTVGAITPLWIVGTVNGAATGANVDAYVVAPEQMRCTPSITATTLTSSVWWVCALPMEAISFNRDRIMRQLAQLSRRVYDMEPEERKEEKLVVVEEPKLQVSTRRSK